MWITNSKRKNCDAIAGLGGHGWSTANFFVFLNKANGLRIDTLKSLANALKSPENGFHVFEFKKGSALQKIILDAEKLDAANQRIAKRYRIAQFQKLK